MGNSRSTLTDLNLFSKGGVFTSQQLDEYQDCTFFTKKDILRLYKRFYALNPSKVGTNMQDSRTSIIKLTFEEVEKMPELKENPFRRRICDVFSEDGYGNLTFDDFLDMFSVFSETAPLHLKLKYAFKIYDYDNDDQLGHDDLSKTIRCLTRDELSDEEVEFIIERIIEEADLDGDEQISYQEFEHAISRSTDFQRVFHIRI
ncbi:Calcium and integrin-binding family member 2 [Aphelenchoides besseyi]|nr:Calcium and integrin-binding family member 2 [Aphelenchoides besseyi]KAI6217349.1 Calcium and integrin-binding family member 2 [Aphelenchoides besseyi]